MAQLLNTTIKNNLTVSGAVTASSRDFPGG